MVAVNAWKIQSPFENSGKTGNYRNKKLTYEYIRSE